MSATRFSTQNFDRVMANGNRIATHTETIETDDDVINVFADMSVNNGMYRKTINDFQSKMERKSKTQERLRLALAKRKASIKN
jgi:hypothetical protein